MLSRDCKRRIDLISKKIEQGDMGVPAAFCYVSPCSGGIFLTGDKMITEIVRSKVEEILQNQNDDDGKPQTEHHGGLCLPETLNGRTL